MKTPRTSRTRSPSLQITADYELFLGRRSGTIEKCLLQPTALLADLVEAHGRRLLLFVDNFFLHRLTIDAAQDSSLGLLLDAVQAQLKALVRRGHSLGVHTHPQWLRSQRVGNEWTFETGAPYRLHDLPIDPANDWSTVRGALISAQKQLETLARDIDPKATVSAFRAGGLCLQPFSALVAPLKESGLREDYSVAPGCSVADGARFYNYEHAPEQESWHFNEDPMEPLEGGPFLEFPVATFRPSLSDKILNALRRALVPKGELKPLGDGQGRPMPRKPVWRRVRSSDPALLTYDYWDANTMGSALRSLLASGWTRVTLLGHPKFLSPYSLKELDAFLKTAAREGWS